MPEGKQLEKHRAICKICQNAFTAYGQQDLCWPCTDRIAEAGLKEAREKGYLFESPRAFDDQ